ncbi:hypothetical protein E5222_14040 [Alteraurantiacibacter aquimixticola]|uniref:Type II CBASS E2 protein domain-containing protein n=1 Tax=Alteraurantiacibacter aquimixticola TaxID=2489173 RepID=A0A4T3F2M4_9SPHN|nr:hypothetical protein E5222_14040 [Alteraurantiacibacter aquimixticola]
MFTSRQPRLTAAAQYLFLRKNPICSGSGSLRAGALTWEYKVRPSLIGREYTVRIEYRQGSTPRVFVIDPSLSELAGDRDLPHVYRDPLRLCLMLPKAFEWDSSMRIDQTFVPWAATWLYYFEEWLASGEWKGGGTHPDPSDTEQLNRRDRRARGR